MVRIGDHDSNDGEDHYDDSETENPSKGELLTPGELDPHRQVKWQCYDHCIRNNIDRRGIPQGNQT